ncbi:alpha/beta fold hydrolase [Mycolicibacterium bacteremicum]|uniref:AB hydrolase-1 domain-containing protein n=1 Tax=Mycolicibacterium bacteremicum TaxID=564198 RepID=A0A1W9YWQ1_MYCBA|nr:alpha/beta fold hydrolase [Mycolicibacterium bacteremicum]MCV7431569.1 alpha/beta fold hydrolase [Mycolicibacterium bacteremicum]ORA04399.1 hypothetical protein BST17_14005 [Mycolicibacterium bacteremicum]
MPVLITPGAFTRASSFQRLADRLGAHIVERPRPRFTQLDTGGFDAVAAELDSATVAARDDGTPLVLIGHSMGGLLCYRAGLARRIDGQVLLMPAPPEGLASDIGRLALRDPISALKFLITGISAAPVRAGWVAPPRGLFSTDASPDELEAAKDHRADESMIALLQLLIGSRTSVREATVPTLVVGGTQDGLVPPGRVRLLAERLGAEHREFDVAHNFSEERKGIIVEEAVEAWLREHALLG